ncbi:hypothetical protein K461DRAFT_158680 [Myriangium duriaei CBS 260.36]|uniref:Secreted protein n=1 Tax=Myriangium duriaei CBS 260.36 TaxID=1168546 RepID=A0A9P4MF26_9PEZI|nr:hypothetical protein K461DRAFT_158680 [Myriangium duriaei CBS 260.36]
MRVRIRLLILFVFAFVLALRTTIGVRRLCRQRGISGCLQETGSVKTTVRILRKQDCCSICCEIAELELPRAWNSICVGARFASLHFTSLHFTHCRNCCEASISHPASPPEKIHKAAGS